MVNARRESGSSPVEHGDPSFVLVFQGFDQIFDEFFINTQMS
jgi:hypothetical protein